MKKLLLATVLATGLAATSAHATFVQADVADTKIFFNNDATNGARLHRQRGGEQHGAAGELHGEDAVDPKNGFATIKPLEMDGNGNFVSLRIVPTENTWSAFTFRGQLEPISFGGEVDLAVVNQFGVTQNFQFTGLAGPDTDFGDIGIKSIDNQRIASITLTAPDGEAFKELKQFEVSAHGRSSRNAPSRPAASSRRSRARPSLPRSPCLASDWSASAWSAAASRWPSLQATCGAATAAPQT
jgi:hypothetical protein